MDSNDYSQLYADAGQTYGVDPQLLIAQGKVEDPSGDPNAQGQPTKYGTAKGVAQLIPATAQSLGVTDPTDPKQAIFAQAKLMKENLDRYGDPETALMAYHGGTDQSNWGPKTQAYPKKVFANYQNTQTADNHPLTQALLDSANEKNLPSGAGTITNNASNDNHPLTQALLDSANEKEVDKTPSLTMGDYAEDVTKSVPTAVVRGVGAIPQIPAYAGNLTAKTEAYLYGKAHDLFSTTPLTPEQNTALQNVQPFITGDTLSDQLVKTGAALTPGVENALGNKLNPQQTANLAKLQQNGISGGLLYNPQTVPGRIVSAGIEGAIGGRLPVAGGAAVGPGVIQNTLSGVGAQGASELYPNNPIATLAGGLIAPGIKGTVSAFNGSPIDPSVAQLAKTLDEDYGIKVPSYQLSNNALAQRAGALMDRFGFGKDNGAPEKFNGAVAEALGASPGHTGLTPDVMNEARTNNSQGYNQILAKIGDIKADNLDTDLQSVIDNAKKTITTNKGAVVDNLTSAANEILDQVKDGDVLPATAFKSLTKTNSTLDDLAKNPDTMRHARMMEDVLHNTLKNSAAPEDVQTLNDLDLKWKNMRTVQGLAAKADITGQISPARLITPVAKSFKDMAYGQNPTDLETLARAGQTFKPLSSSQTAENAGMMKLLGTVPELATGAGAHVLGATLPMAAGTAAGMWGGGKLLGKALTSDTYRNYLINNALNTPAQSMTNNPLLNYSLPATSVAAGAH